MSSRDLVLPIAILVAGIGGGGFYYAAQVSKQESIERQQQAQLQVERAKQETEARQEEQKRQDDLAARDAKTAQDQKEYFADRKSDCLTVYKTESDKWNNVSGWRYSEDKDTCYIQYKESSPKSDQECDRLYPTKDGLASVFFMDNILCKDGRFENAF